MVPIFKGKGIIQECGNYRDIKLSYESWYEDLENDYR